MKNYTLILICLFFIQGCHFFSNEQRAIKIVKQTKVSGLNNLSYQGYNWQEFSNQIANKHPNLTYSWSADCDKFNTCLVSFKETSGTGHFWEIVLTSEVILYVNNNDFLSRKYGITNSVNDKNFVQDEYFGSDFSKSSEKNYVRYFVRADIINNSTSNIINVTPSSELNFIYKDETISFISKNEYELIDGISHETPWLPGDTRQIFVVIDGINKSLVNNKPEYMTLEIRMNGENEEGEIFTDLILDKNVEEDWESYVFYSNFDDNSNKYPAENFILNLIEEPIGYYIPENEILMKNGMILDNIMIDENENGYTALICLLKTGSSPLYIQLNNVLFNLGEVSFTDLNPEKGNVFFKGKFIDSNTLIESGDIPIIHGVININNESFNVKLRYYSGY